MAAEGGAQEVAGGCEEEEEEAAARACAVTEREFMAAVEKAEEAGREVKGAGEGRGIRTLLTSAGVLR